MAFEVEGIDYSPEGIEALRAELVQMRDEAMKHWPESIDFTLILTHTVALLAHLADMKREQAAKT